MKVLTVDDNPMAGILLSDALRDLGHQPVIVEEPSAAMSFFEQEQPQVCILDWMMPDVDGLELACAIRKHAHGQAVYIIMLSAKQDLESIGLAYELGVDDFISKPIAQGELKARLHAAARFVTLREDYARKCEDLAGMAAEVARLRNAA